VAVVFCESGDTPPAFLPEQYYVDAPAEGKHYSLSFNPARTIVQPNAFAETLVTFVPYSPSRLRTRVEIHVQHGRTEYLDVRGEVQAPKIILTPMCMDLDVMLAGMHSFKGIERNLRLQLKNLTNLPAEFSWPRVEPEDCVVEFSPESGILAGKGVLGFCFVLCVE
jgi:hypothetical protein